MKKAILLLLLLSICLLLFGFFQNQTTQAGLIFASNPRTSLIVVESTTKKILLEENSQVKLPMASTTKVATAIVAIENCVDLDAKHKIPKEAVGIEGSSIYLVEDEELSIRELLYGLMLRSGNDAAEAISILIAGSRENFVALMNALPGQLGLSDTHFCNPSGLHHNDHYTTAYDFAMISSYAMQNAIFREIVATKQIKISNTSQSYPRVLINKNKMLSQYEGANGIKTGFTKKSGRCLVSSSQRDNLNLVCVVLNRPNMWEDSKNAMSFCFDKFENREIVSSGLLEQTLPVTNGENCNTLRLAAAQSFLFTCRKTETPKFNIECVLPESIKAPVKANSVVGKIKVFDGNDIIFSTDILAVDNIERIKIVPKEFDRVIDGWVILP